MGLEMDIVLLARRRTSVSDSAYTARAGTGHWLGRKLLLRGLVRHSARLYVPCRRQALQKWPAWMCLSLTDLITSLWPREHSLRDLRASEIHPVSFVCCVAASFAHRFISKQFSRFTQLDVDGHLTHVHVLGIFRMVLVFFCSPECIYVLLSPATVH